MYKREGKYIVDCICLQYISTKNKYIFGIETENLNQKYVRKKKPESTIKFTILNWECSI